MYDNNFFKDTENVYTQVISEIARSYGKQYTVETRLKVLGTPEMMTAKVAVEEMQLPVTPEQFLNIYKPRCLELLTNPNLMPGILFLILHLPQSIFLCIIYLRC